LSIADALTDGDETLLTDLLGAPLVVAPNNFVERPWGGAGIRGYKGLHPLPDQHAVSGHGLGEAFELAAFDEDAEAARYPSIVRFSDGSAASLPRLLSRFGDRILGDSFVRRYGRCLPLLPKTLDVRELLSVQGHPPGHTEVYIVIDAEPGATLGLGFAADIDPEGYGSRLRAGLDRQKALLQLLHPDADLHALHGRLSRWFARRESGADSARDAAADSATELVGELLAPGISPTAAANLLDELKRDYWFVLDSLNRIEVSAGQVIYNATPDRLLQRGQKPSAEVHALGNPERKEVVALEVRLPGPTFRAWDNVRFPQRDVDVDAALAALNLRASSEHEFIREEAPDPARPGVSISVDCEYFRIEHCRPAPGAPCTVPVTSPVCMHVIAGAVQIECEPDGSTTRLTQGQSALVPASIAECELSSDGGAHVVCVTLPCG